MSVILYQQSAKMFLERTQNDLGSAESNLYEMALAVNCTGREQQINHMRAKIAGMAQEVRELSDLINT